VVSQAQPLLRPCSHPCIVQRRQGSSLAIIMQGAYTIFSSLASLCKIIVVNFNRLYCTRLVDREISTYSSCYVSTMYTLIYKETTAFLCALAAVQPQRYPYSKRGCPYLPTYYPILRYEQTPLEDACLPLGKTSEHVDRDYKSFAICKSTIAYSKARAITS
jgi:hypothetical protein